MLSIIVPAYNEEQMVPLAEQAISQLMQQENIPYELLFINDGSKDSTWARICHAAGRKERKCCRSEFQPKFRQGGRNVRRS